MPKVAVTYSPEVGGASVISLKNSFSSVNCEVVDADYREMMRGIPKEEFDEAYKTSEGRSRIFAHAKFIAEKFLDNVDCLALSGNSAMIDPDLFNQERMEGQSYDFSRTIAELALVHVATQRGMPVMGVCGGHQVVAVYGGGTIKDLNAAELDKQRFLNYDAIRFNADSMLKQIIGQNLNSDNPLEQEFFGAHNQAVDELGKGFLKTAIGSDGKLIEAAESEHGAPLITTQFHPEVAVHGLPNSPFLYKKMGLEREISLKIFDFFAKAGETYRNKKKLANEIKDKIEKIENHFVKGKGKEKRIKTKPDKINKGYEAKKSVKEEKTKPNKKQIKTLIEMVKTITNFIAKGLDKLRSFFVTKISNGLTSKKVKDLKKKEALQEQVVGSDGLKKENTKKIDKSKSIDSTGKIIKNQMENSHQLPKREENNTDFDDFLEKENQSPVEIMINQPAKVWPEKKQDILNGLEVTKKETEVSSSSDRSVEIR
jgi:gamma-glutamyl-gamma-aminobutyrate hydrolase PuuD